MNQDTVKEKLLLIEDAPIEFSVIFSGKKSKKVNGLYKINSREILIHNKNFMTDDTGQNLLLYTAIHEYAHYLHACKRGGTLSPRAHNSEFWAIFHDLLDKAQAKKIYKDIFSVSPELLELTEVIRNKYLKNNGELVKEMGKHLIKAHNLCFDIGVRFEDYVDRMLRIPRAAANTAIKMFEYDIAPELGADNMRFLAGIRNEDDRKAAQSALIKGKSPDSVKIQVKGIEINGSKEALEDPIERLEKEKARLEKTIASLNKRLEEVKKELSGKK